MEFWLWTFADCQTTSVLELALKTLSLKILHLSDVLSRREGQVFWLTKE